MDSFFAASLGLSNPYKSRYTSATTSWRLD